MGFKCQHRWYHYIGFGVPYAMCSRCLKVSFWMRWPHKPKKFRDDLVRIKNRYRRS